MSASLEHSSYPAREPSLEGFESALAEGIAEAVRHGGTTMLALPARLAPSEALLAETTADAVAWAAPSGFELSALGFAHVIEASGVP